VTSAVVIGAGVVGASVAYHLADAGYAVTVVEAGSPAGAASGHTFARLCAFDKDPYEYFRLTDAGIREHSALAGRLHPGTPGAAPWLHLCTTFIWADAQSRGRFERRVAQLTEWGYPLRWRDVDDANTELAAPVRAGAVGGPLVQATSEGWVDAPALTTRLLAAAGEGGAVLRTGSRVVALEWVGERWQVGLELPDGSAVTSADVVVNVAGTGADAVASLAGVPLDLTRSRGLLVDLETPGDPVRHIVHGTRVSIRPDGPGRAVIRSDQVDQRLAAEPDPVPAVALAELSTDLLGRATAVIPALEAATVRGRRIGRRVLPAGGYPLVGGIPERPGYYHSVSHSGVILAPLIGRLLATEITAGRLDDLLRPYHAAGMEAAAGVGTAGVGRSVGGSG
jgi:glycine/D-amino acid oxidase-like deaminating enzyme